MPFFCPGDRVELVWVNETDRLSDLSCGLENYIAELGTDFASYPGYNIPSWGIFTATSVFYLETDQSKWQLGAGWMEQIQDAVDSVRKSIKKQEPKCECGAWKVGHKIHSHWCPMRKLETDT